MRSTVCVLLAFSILLSGCAGREANLVQIRQMGDEQKPCDQLRSDMAFIDNEITRLLPKSDKTGKNIALGATGILFIIPLFFMDLKQGEKKEIEAYRQRYNHLLMITQQRDCKLPNTIVKEVAVEETSEATTQLKTCLNCGEKIGALEESHVFEDHVVCAICYLKLEKQKGQAKQAASSDAETKG
ncbi:MAG TPA: hypothetical protein ENH94_11705 [Phycisphaerales bacterium]|nr:hypothetical protein [Phycisphaerales bacterium]